MSKIEWKTERPITKAEVPLTGLVICSFCWQIMPSSEVTDFTDDNVAICPECYVDAMFVLTKNIANVVSYHNTMFSGLD